MVQDSAYIVVDKDISTDESYRKQSLSNNISIADFFIHIQSGKNYRMHMWNYPIYAHH